MIKNLNDVLNIFSLIVLVIGSLRIFIWALLPKNEVTDKFMSKYELFLNYIDDEDE